MQGYMDEIKTYVRVAKVECTLTGNKMHRYE